MQGGIISILSYEGYVIIIGQLKEMFFEQIIENMECVFMVKGDLLGVIDYFLMEGNKDQSKRIVEVSQFISQ